jgi:hypothetical protein
LGKEILRKKLNFIANMQEIIDKRRLDWLGNVERQPDSKLCKKFLLTAWVQNKRAKRGQNNMLHKYNAMAINRLLTYNDFEDCPSKDCPSKSSWIPPAKRHITVVEPSLQVQDGSPGEEEAPQTRTINHPSTGI